MTKTIKITQDCSLKIIAETDDTLYVELENGRPAMWRVAQAIVQLGYETRKNIELFYTWYPSPEIKDIVIEMAWDFKEGE